MQQSCNTKLHPDNIYKQHPELKGTGNTQAAEQTFVWLGRYKKIVWSITKVHHLFYVHHKIYFMFVTSPGNVTWPICSSIHASQCYWTLLLSRTISWAIAKGGLFMKMTCIRFTMMARCCCHCCTGNNDSSTFHCKQVIYGQSPLIGIHVGTMSEMYTTYFWHVPIPRFIHLYPLFCKYSNIRNVFASICINVHSCNVFHAHKTGSDFLAVVRFHC